MQDLRKGLFDVLIGVNFVKDWIYQVSLWRSWMPIKKAFATFTKLTDQLDADCTAYTMANRNTVANNCCCCSTLFMNRHDTACRMQSQKRYFALCCAFKTYRFVAQNAFFTILPLNRAHLERLVLLGFRPIRIAVCLMASASFICRNHHDASVMPAYKTVESFEIHSL
jgi:hypothetical protein